MHKELVKLITVHKCKNAESKDSSFLYINFMLI